MVDSYGSFVLTFEGFVHAFGMPNDPGHYGLMPEIRCPQLRLFRLLGVSRMST